MRGSIVNILKTTLYSYEVKGDKPALWVEIKPINFQTVYPGDGPQPPAAPGAEIVKVSFGRTPRLEDNSLCCQRREQHLRHRQCQRSHRLAKKLSEHGNAAHTGYRQLPEQPECHAGD